MTVITAGLQDTIKRIFVREGDFIRFDQLLMIMGNTGQEKPFFSPVSGMIKRIKVRESDIVSTGEVMIEIEWCEDPCC